VHKLGNWLIETTQPDPTKEGTRACLIFVTHNLRMLLAASSGI